MIYFRIKKHCDAQIVISFPNHLNSCYSKCGPWQIRGPELGLSNTDQEGHFGDSLVSGYPKYFQGKYGTEAFSFRRVLLKL